MAQQVTLIGFGEAAQAFASAGDWQASACAYDKLTDAAAARSAKEADYRAARVRGCESNRAAVTGAELILSLVTADQALAAAIEAARNVEPGAVFCDMNSVSPATKQAAATVIEAQGGRYVDVAVMSPVNPGRLAVPLLLSGAEAAAGEEALRELGFSNLRVVGPRVGQASSIKMIRSVIVKGIEALTAEAMLAADAAGVADEVLASLDASEKARSWTDRADYNLDRIILHGLRRAEEMVEVAKTLQDLGIEPLMAAATARRQREIGSLGLGQPAAGLTGKIDQIKGRKAEAA